MATKKEESGWHLKHKKFLGKGIDVRLYWTDFAWVFCIASMFIVCLELFYRMIVDYNDKYESDMHYYAITTITNGDKHARLFEIFSKFLYNINQNTMEFNVYLAAVIAMIIVCNFLLVNYYIKCDSFHNDVPRYAIQIVSLVVIFTGPIYMPVLHPWYFRHSFESFVWHNPTQQSMIMFSILATICLLKMFNDYENGISIKWWMGTMIMCILSTSAKPAFVINLVITIIIFFLVELFRKDGKLEFKERFIRLFIMGCAVVPSGLYTIFISTYEFGNNAVNDVDAHIVFGPAPLFNTTGLLRNFIFGMGFTIIVFIANYKRFRESNYFFAFLMFISGVLQWALISETGDRAKHGNFDWGRLYGTYFLAMICLGLLLENIYIPETVFPNNKKARKIYLVIVFIVLALSVLSQLKYFKLILTGHGYML